MQQPHGIPDARHRRVGDGGSPLRTAGEDAVQLGGVVEQLGHPRAEWGHGLDDDVTVGPLIDDAAMAKVADHVDDARRKGARLVIGGAAATPRPGLTARFFQPTILDGFTDQMKVCHEETFGPVAPVRRFTTEDEAIALANASPFGLAAYFYTRDASRLMRVAERLEYGIVGANDGAPSTAQAPFGGVKASGFGREGGRYVMHEYLDIKYVSWGLG